MSLDDWLFINTAQNSEVFTPKSIPHLIHFLKHDNRPIAIAGEQYSSGGQTLIDNGVIISMRQLNKILHVDPHRKEYTVEAGATWAQVISKLIKYDLVPAEMQSYHSFSVGGAISVNAHGRMGKRISDTIVSLDILTLDGHIYTCSTNHNEELYHAVIGGYGLIGFIVRTTLKARRNHNIVCRVFPSRGLNYIKEEISAFRRDHKKILYNCDISAEWQIHHIVWYPTSASSQEKPQIQSSNFLNNLFTRLGEQAMILCQPLHNIYQAYRPYRLNGQIRSLSYEMGYDARCLVPVTIMRTFQSLLQEYFLPQKYLGDFLQNAYLIIRKHRVIVLNMSIRLVESQACGYLDWFARPSNISNIEDTHNINIVAVVLYLNVKNYGFPFIQKKYDEFTQELIQLVLSLGGSWYLPYIPSFTPLQLKTAYPNLSKFIQVKQEYDRIDPLRSKNLIKSVRYRLQSKFWLKLMNLKITLE